MPKDATVHYNLQTGNGKTRCGLPLRTFEWRTDRNDVTCNNCLRLTRNKEG